ncbi:MFP1 attachment factor 1-like [Triticum urartu]|uniref:MFP1 attachment factor 1-like n=1 Tax=Triticum urartu TaxID=4572 RepID=UPI002044BDCA|nr:MFP1 attachment factor 1-like [Triticum urartu]
MAEDAPNAGAEDIHPAPTESFADAAAPPASAEKSSSETLLPSLSIWPPSQRTRDAVVRRVVQTLSAPSVLSQRYGAIPEPEAEVAAAAVEAEAFAAASESAAASPASLEDGIEVLQAYSKEVSRRLLELAKSRAAAAAAAPETPAEPSGEESEGSSVTAPPPTEE